MRGAGGPPGGADADAALAAAQAAQVSADAAQGTADSAVAAASAAQGSADAAQGSADAALAAAAFAPTVTPGSVAIASGVPTTVWSYTLAEGEVIGGELKVTGGIVALGVTKRTRGTIDFGASRSVGGVAEVSDNGPLENGSMVGGTIAIVASGNDAQVQVTFTETGTFTYAVRLELDSVAIPQI